jgi:DNA-binding transcriptional LysR family regulator
MTYSAGIDTEELYLDRMHVIVSESHRLARLAAVSPSALMRETLVLLDASPSPENVRSYFAAQGHMPRPKYRFQDFDLSWVKWLSALASAW